MPKLNEYLGGLLSSFTKAKILSDLQTAQVAEQYAKHHLLKHFSVPRMKIEDVEMTIPIALDQMAETPQTDQKYIDKASVNTLVYREVLSTLGLRTLPKSLSTNLRNFISQETQLLENRIKVNEGESDFKSYSDIVANYINSMEKDLPKLSNKSEEAKRKAAIKSLPNKLQKTLISEVEISRDKIDFQYLNVIVESYKLKDIKSENLIHIKLKISEEGMEWDRSENSDGEVTSKLIPE